VNRILKFIKHPSWLIVWLGSRLPWAWFIPDKCFLKIKYFLTFGKKLNLRNPETFNEKLQWLKLYDRKPEYTHMADKYEVRKYIIEKK
jgi:hypothetical protein